MGEQDGAHAATPPAPLLLSGAAALPLIRDQDWDVNDLWGSYAGTAFCHDLCAVEGLCSETRTNTSYPPVIESPVSLSITGDLARFGVITGGYINFDWQVL